MDSVIEGKENVKDFMSVTYILINLAVIHFYCHVKSTANLYVKSNFNNDFAKECIQFSFF